MAASTSSTNRNRCVGGTPIIKYVALAACIHVSKLSRLAVRCTRRRFLVQVQQRLTELAQRMGVTDDDLLDFVQRVIDLVAREEGGVWYYRGGDALEQARQAVRDYFSPDLPDGFEFLAEWYTDAVQIPLSGVCRFVLRTPVLSRIISGQSFYGRASHMIGLV